MIKGNLLIILFAVVLLYGCHKQHRQKLIVNTFSIPLVKQAYYSDSIALFEVDSIAEVYPEFVGKFKFTDELTFEDQMKKSEISPLKNLLFEYDGNHGNDTFSTDGFQIFADYNTTINCNGERIERGSYYPVYVVNETSRTKLFTGKDGHAFAIQEALDTSLYRWGQWEPIERRGMDFCGNGYWGLKVQPGEFVMFLARKYKGIDTTLLRLRVQIGEHIYISKPYTGVFNNKQFTGGSQQNTPTDYNYIFYNFYGAKPKGIKDNNY